jgi:hypothetical protein
MELGFTKYLFSTELWKIQLVRKLFFSEKGLDVLISIGGLGF